MQFLSSNGLTHEPPIIGHALHLVTDEVSLVHLVTFLKAVGIQLQDYKVMPTEWLRVEG
jgi:hypothetical protein